MTNANLQSRLDESQSKVQALQEEIIKLQVHHTAHIYMYTCMYMHAVLQCLELSIGCLCDTLLEVFSQDHFTFGDTILIV